MVKITDVYQEISTRVEYREDGSLYWSAPLNRTDWIGREVGSVDRGGYRYTYFRGKTVLLHRLVFFMHHGFLPRIVDHVNRDRSDNRIDNLRACDGFDQNGRNANPRIGFTSIFKGVSWAKTKRKWRASANHNGKSKCLGHYSSEVGAALAYNRFAREHYGDFAVLNDVEDHRPT